MREEAEKNGYELLVMDPDMDVKKQSDQIDDFIAKSVRAIVLVPVDQVPLARLLGRLTQPGFRFLQLMPNVRQRN